MSFYFSIYLSACLPIYLSFYLSNYQSKKDILSLKEEWHHVVWRQMDTIGGHNVKWSSRVSKTKITWFVSHVEDTYKRAICPHKQKWSYLSSHVQQACHSATTLWNSGKEGKEKGMMGKGMRLRWRNTLVDVLYTYEIQQWNLMPLLEVGQEEDDLERCSGRFNQSTI
jgi:hypothetical protein